MTSTPADHGVYPGIPIIQSLHAEAPRLVIYWKGGGRDTIDFTKMIARVNVFAPLEDPGEFNTAKVVDVGVAVEWDCGLDLSGSTLKRMAEEQR